MDAIVQASFLNEILLQCGHRWCVIGSGGKTWFVHRSIDILRGQCPIAVAPSTRVFVPQIPGQVDEVCLLSHDQAIPVTAPRPDAVVAFGRDTQGGKLLGLQSERIDQIWKREQRCLILTEGDGSRGFPLKEPASWEPIIPSLTEVVLWIVGFWSLGLPAQKAVHRWSRFEGCQEYEVIDEAFIERLVVQGRYPAMIPPSAHVFVVATGGDEHHRSLMVSILRGLRLRSFPNVRGILVPGIGIGEPWFEIQDRSFSASRNSRAL